MQTSHCTLGADIIECDVGVTKDKELVCLHDAYLSGTTNVASISKFNGRKQWRNYEGVRYNDWWVVDFTLAELKERVPSLPPNWFSERECYQSLFLNVLG